MTTNIPPGHRGGCGTVAATLAALTALTTALARRNR